MKNLCLVFLIALFYACQPSAEEQLEYVSGYWEIVQVNSHSGVSKDYRYNTTIDYIYLDNLNGFRKKLQPGINNQYKASNDAEYFEVRIENDSLNIYYRTPLDSWKETILTANEKELKIINADQMVYIYQRYEPLELDIESP